MSELRGCDSMLTNVAVRSTSEWVFVGVLLFVGPASLVAR